MHIINQDIYIFQKNHSILFLYTKETRWYELPCENIRKFISFYDHIPQKIGTITFDELFMSYRYQLFYLCVKQKQKFVCKSEYYDHLKFLPIPKILHFKLSPHTNLIFHSFELIQINEKIHFINKNNPRERYSRYYLEEMA